MAAFVIRRILWMSVVLFCVSVLTFALMHSVPGGPFSREKEVPPQVLAALEAKYNLDVPITQQYVDYMGDVLIPRITDSSFRRTPLEDYLINIQLPNGHAFRWMNFGPSFRERNRTVSSMIAFHLPASFQLGSSALAVALAIGVPSGIFAALNRNTRYDYLSMGIAIIGVSVPTIISGPLLQYFFGVHLKILPIAGWDSWQHLILPAFALGFAQSAIIARLTRASLLQVLNEDYIRTARSKGLRESSVILIHALKNALIPVATILGPMVAFLVTGSFVTETIFGIPGIGRFFVNSIANRDYPLIMGTVLLFALFLVVANTMVDIVYAWLDPRIRFD